MVWVPSALDPPCIKSQDITTNVSIFPPASLPSVKFQHLSQPIKEQRHRIHTLWGCIRNDLTALSLTELLCDTYQTEMTMKDHARNYFLKLSSLIADCP